MIIDIHTHAFPDSIAQKAIEKLSARSGNLQAYTDGTVEDLRQKMKSWGVDRFAILNIATNEKQQKNVNDFALSMVNDPDIIMFGSVYPHSQDFEQELDRVSKGGLKGIKLHCEYQDFFADDKKVFPLYEKIQSLGLPVIFHSGSDAGYLPPVRCMPHMLVNVHKNFKDLKIIAAHLGGYNETDEVIECMAGKSNIFIDVSLADSWFSREKAFSVIDKHGSDFLLFGSDCPWDNAQNNIQFIESLNIPSSKKLAILGENAKNLLDL